MAKRNLLNVRKFIEWVEETTVFMLKENESSHPQGPQGLNLPPIYEAELHKIGFIARSILRNHASKNTRKDIYVERR